MLNIHQADACHGLQGTLLQITNLGSHSYIHIHHGPARSSSSAYFPSPPRSDLSRPSPGLFILSFQPSTIHIRLTSSPFRLSTAFNPSYKAPAYSSPLSLTTSYHRTAPLHGTFIFPRKSLSILQQSTQQCAAVARFPASSYIYRLDCISTFLINLTSLPKHCSLGVTRGL
jgi:hypothetical protein